MYLRTTCLPVVRFVDSALEVFLHIRAIQMYIYLLLTYLLTLWINQKKSVN